MKKEKDSSYTKLVKTLKISSTKTHVKYSWFVEDNKIQEPKHNLTETTG